MFIRVPVFVGTAQYTTINLKYRRSGKRAKTLEYSLFPILTINKVWISGCPHKKLVVYVYWKQLTEYVG